MNQSGVLERCSRTTFDKERERWVIIGNRTIHNTSLFRMFISVPLRCLENKARRMSRRIRV